MSRRKRRKRNTKKEEEEETTDPFKKFQYEVVKCLDPFQSCKIFCGSWKLVVQREWWTSTGEQLVKKVKDASRGRKKAKGHPLYRALKFVNFPILKKIYKNHFKNRQKTIRREITVWEIIYKFFGEETPLEKRANEKSNLSEIDNIDELIRFITLCGVTIPIEIINIIFSNLPKNLKTITTIGRVCKHFYISFLSSWNHVKVRKRNVYKIPLLVLRTVRSIDIWGGILHSDLDYLWPKLNPDKFRSLVLCGETNRVFNSLHKYQKLCSEKNQVYTLKNVCEIRFRGGIFDWNSSDVSLFPKGIGSLMGLPPNHLTHPCPSQQIQFKSIPQLSDVYSEDEEETKEEEIIEILKENYEKVTSLSLGTVDLQNFLPERQVIGRPNDLRTHFKKTVECFPNIKQLDFHLVCYQVSSSFDIFESSYQNNIKFDFSTFNSFHSLKKLSIKNGFHHSRFSSRNIMGIFSNSSSEAELEMLPTETSGAISVDYNLQCSSLEELEIASPSNISYNSPIIDFNLEDMISKSYFFNPTRTTYHPSNLHQHNNIKKLKVDIPLCSRRRDLERTYLSLRRTQPNIFRTLCHDVSVTIEKLMEFLSSENTFLSFETLELKIRVPKGWRKCERWFFRYDKAIKRIRMQMYLRASAINVRGKVDSLSDIVLLVEDQPSEEFLFEKRLPGILMVREFVLRVLPKVSRFVNLVVFEKMEFYGSGSKNVGSSMVEFFGSAVDGHDLKDSFVFDEGSMSFVNLSVL